MRSNTDSHIALACNWLKSSKKMEALYQQETKIVELLALYKLQKAKGEDGLINTLSKIYEMVNRYEQILNGEDLSSPIQVQTEQLKNVQHFNSENTNEVKSYASISVPTSRQEHSTNQHLTQQGKPIEWDSWTIEQRLAYRQNKGSGDTPKEHHYHYEPVGTLTKESVTPRAQQGNVDDKFDLKARNYNDTF